MGVCHFPTFYKAMDAAQHLVTLDPVAVELIDSTMLDLARSIAIFKPTVEQYVHGAPAALLVVEFAEDDPSENQRKLAELEKMMAGLGYGWDKPASATGGVVCLTEPDDQARITEMRKSGLNIMMSMKTEAKPVSFVEDCAVELSDLAEYTDQLTRIFEKYGTTGTGMRMPRSAVYMYGGAEYEARRRCRGNARHCRRRLCTGQALWRIAFRRAWRRHCPI